MKEKFAKIFKIVRIIVSITCVISLVISITLNIAMRKILKTEAEENGEFFELKVAIAQCYLEGKNGLLGGNEGLYKDVLHSNKCESDIDLAKWIATGIEVGGNWANYKAEMHLPFKQKIELRIDDETLQAIIDNNEVKSKELIMEGQPIELVMKYNMTDELFIVEIDYG